MRATAIALAAILIALSTVACDQDNSDGYYQRRTNPFQQGPQL